MTFGKKKNDLKEKKSLKEEKIKNKKNSKERVIKRNLEKKI